MSLLVRRNLLRFRKEILLSITVLIALTGIFGWIFKIDLFTGRYHNFIPMAPLTSIMLIINSAGLFFFIHKNGSGIPRVTILLFSITFVISLAILFQFSLKLTTDIESIFGNINQGFGTIRRGRISHVTAILFFFTSLSVLLQRTEAGLLYKPGKYIPVLIFGYAFLLIMGYAYNTPFLYTGNVIPVALPTSLAFLLMSLVLIDLFKIGFFPKTHKPYKRIANQLSGAFIPVSVLIVAVHAIVDAKISYFTTNPAVVSFVLLLVTLGILIAAVLYISKVMGISIERLENDKLRLQEEKQQVLREQNLEYSSLNEEYKAINEELNQINEDLQSANKTITLSEEKYRRLFENMINGFAHCKLIYEDGKPVDFVYLEVNKAFETLTGLKNVINRRISEVIPGITKSNPKLMETYSRVVLSGTSERIETFLEPNGMWMEISVYSSGKDQFVTIFDVITERKKAEHALIESRKQLFDIIDNTPAFIYAVDNDGRFILANNTLAGSFKSTRKGVLGRTRFDFLPQEIAEQHRQNDMDVIRQKRSAVFEETNMEPDGIHTYYTVKFPLLDSLGEIYSVCGVSMDITHLKVIQEELRCAKERAEESDRLKTAFLQNMSHEIRTPMNAIMGFAQLMPTNIGNKEKLERFSEIICQRCEDLLEIINGILDISKIESGQIPMVKEICNLPEIFEELKGFFKEQQIKLKKQNISFDLKCEDKHAPVNILTDKVKLMQIFINLISNAFKFTREGKIEGGCMVDEQKELIFYVSDTGLGIPPDKHQYIFERFTQVQNDQTRLTGGTGLGLPIVKGLVELMGGRVWLDSTPGTGTTFYFTIQVN